MLLKRELKRLPSNFVAERLLKMVEADDLRKETIANCDHDYQKLYGFHEQCTKCTGLKNGYEIWVCEDLKYTVDRGNGDPTTHQSQDYGNAGPSIPTNPDQA